MSYTRQELVHLDNTLFKRLWASWSDWEHHIKRAIADQGLHLGSYFLKKWGEGACQFNLTFYRDCTYNTIIQIDKKTWDQFNFHCSCFLLIYNFLFIDNEIIHAHATLSKLKVAAVDANVMMKFIVNNKTKNWHQFVYFFSILLQL